MAAQTAPCMLGADDVTFAILYSSGKLQASLDMLDLSAHPLSAGAVKVSAMLHFVV